MVEFTHDVLTAQAIAFFGDGFETSSTAMGFAIFEVAYNSDVQEKLREEVDAVVKKHGGKLTYDGIQEMHYLDMVIAGNLLWK
jgi:cytochrome P450 family 6